MFLNVEDFISDLLQEEHTVRILKWKNREKLASFREKLPLEIRNQEKKLSVLTVSAKDFDSRDFLEELLNITSEEETIRTALKATCLFIVDIEPIVPDAGKILNSFREHLGEFRASIIMVRNDEYHNFTINCPDLLDWIRGSHIESVDDFATSFTADDVEDSIKAFEDHYNMSSSEFLKHNQSNRTRNIRDAWLWKELLEILDILRNNSDRLTRLLSNLEPGLTPKF